MARTAKRVSRRLAAVAIAACAVFPPTAVAESGVNVIDNNVIWNVPGRFDPAKVPVEPGSSGWYKTREHDVINGYGIYGEGTDRLLIENNLIGKCRHSGYYLKPVGFRMHGLERGGTSRNAKIFNNLFYDCGEAAIVFPTRDNEAEGNLYVRMNGGYLRVMYPEPEVCLNLPAWQEFCGFDLEGKNGWFDILFDEKAGTVTFRTSKDQPFGFRGEAERLKLVTNPGEVAGFAGPWKAWMKTGNGEYTVSVSEME